MKRKIKQLNTIWIVYFCNSPIPIIYKNYFLPKYAYCLLLKNERGAKSWAPLGIRKVISHANDYDHFKIEVKTEYKRQKEINQSSHCYSKIRTEFVRSTQPDIVTVFSSWVSDSCTRWIFLGNKCFFCLFISKL